MPHSNIRFHAEIQALDEHFRQYFYAYQRDWLEGAQINFQAVQSLWDILNNVYDNLDDLGVSPPELTPALEIVEAMNAMATEVRTKGQATDAGIIFAGTRQEYEAIGNALLARLYELETHVAAVRRRLMQMSQQ